MLDPVGEPPPFERLGTPGCDSPVVLSVPHAGRHYPPSLLADSRLPTSVLDQLADQEADRLIKPAITTGAVAIVARNARAWLDLNRHPDELDPAMIVPRPPASALHASPRVRAGLGLIPRRVAGHGEVLRAPLPLAEITRRLRHDHEPYHGAIAAALAQARAQFGWAILLDIHSMPPLERGEARVVIGDRHGRSAGAGPRNHVLSSAQQRWPAVRNIPYAGGYTLERHGQPRKRVHAVQIEFDRGLYLTPDGLFDAVRAQPLAAWLANLVAEFGQEAMAAE